MLNLKYSVVVSIEQLWIKAQHNSATANTPSEVFADNLVFYINESIANCWKYNRNQYEIAFRNEEDLMKFFLSFDEDHFYTVYDTLEQKRRQQALERIIKQANELNW